MRTEQKYQSFSIFLEYRCVNPRSTLCFVTAHRFVPLTAQLSTATDHRPVILNDIDSNIFLQTAVIEERHVRESIDP